MPLDGLQSPTSVGAISPNSDPNYGYGSLIAQPPAVSAAPTDPNFGYGSLVAQPTVVTGGGPTYDPNFGYGSLVAQPAPVTGGGGTYDPSFGYGNLVQQPVTTPVTGGGPTYDPNFGYGSLVAQPAPVTGGGGTYDPSFGYGNLVQQPVTTPVTGGGPSYDPNFGYGSLVAQPAPVTGGGGTYDPSFGYGNLVTNRAATGGGGTAPAVDVTAANNAITNNIANIAATGVGTQAQAQVAAQQMAVNQAQQNAAQYGTHTMVNPDGSTTVMANHAPMQTQTTAQQTVSPTGIGQTLVQQGVQQVVAQPTTQAAQQSSAGVRYVMLPQQVVYQPVVTNGQAAAVAGASGPAIASGAAQAVGGGGTASAYPLTGDPGMEEFAKGYESLLAQGAKQGVSATGGGPGGYASEKAAREAQWMKQYADVFNPPPVNRAPATTTPATTAPATTPAAPSPTAARPAATTTAGGPAAPAASAATAGSFRQRLIDIARKEVGVKESDGNNHGEEIKKYRRSVIGSDGDGQSWCAYFLSWVFNQAGKPIVDGNGDGYVPAVQGWAVRAKKWHARGTKAPTAGDIVIFQSKGVYSHIGLVESVDANGTIHTIEGNSSNQVKRNTYAASSTYVAGFVDPE